MYPIRLRIIASNLGDLAPAIRWNQPRGLRYVSTRWSPDSKCDTNYGHDTDSGERITMTRGRTIIVVATAACLVAARTGDGQDQPKVGYKDTPMLPGGKWHVHDGDRPLPPVVTPGTCSTQEEPGRPPSDAVVLFDGKDLSHWRGQSGKPAAWKIEDGCAGDRAGGRRDRVDGRVWRLPAPPRIRRRRSRREAATRAGATAA